MKAYVLATGRCIEPFGDPVAEACIGNRRLHELQDEALRAAGLEPERIERLEQVSADDCLLVRDHVFFSVGILDRFLAMSETRPGSSVLAIPKDHFVNFTGAIQDIVIEKDHASPSGERAVYAIYRLRGEAPTEESLQALPRLVLGLREGMFPIDLSAFGARGHELKIPVPRDGIVFHVTSWVHIWLASVFAIGLRWAQVLKGHKLWVVAIFLRSLFTWGRSYRSRVTFGFLQRLNVIGKGCLIHPTASVEACILGDGVHIGAGAQVRGCIIGDHASVGEQGIINGTVIGDHTTIAQQAILNLTVVYPNSFVKTMQGGLVGSEAFVAGRVRIYDLKLEGTIKILHEGRMVDTGMNFLAGCVGHRASISGPVWIYQGRAVPNGYRIIQHPRQVVAKIPQGLPEGGFLVNQGGTLGPLQAAKAESRGEGATGGGDGGGDAAPAAGAKGEGS